MLTEEDDALAMFNKLMTMETFSLLDDESQCYKRSDLHLYEMYQTRLLRVDIGLSSRGDPLQRMIHKWLRALRYRRLSSKFKKDEEIAEERNEQYPSPAKHSYQNTVFLAEIISRFLVALFGSVFMVVPLVMISYQERQEAHLITVAIWIIAFSLLVSVVMKVSNQATMGVVAAYAAILSVFVSNS